MQAASSVTEPDRPKRKVVDRRRIHNGGEIVQVSVPAKQWVKHIQARFNGQDLNYIQFGQKIHLYVHDADPTRFIGKQVVGQVEVHEKTMDDGAKYLYIDVMPLRDQNKTPTHKMTLVQGKVPERYRTEHFEVVDSPTPDEGGVVFSPLRS